MNQLEALRAVGIYLVGGVFLFGLTWAAFQLLRKNMKKALSLLIFLGVVFMPLLVVAQQTDETVTIKKSELTKDQLDKIEAQAMQQKIDQYGKWVGVGHKVGTAINEGLAAVTTNANNFAQTSPGKLTMFLIAYKVIGHDVLGVIVGIPLLLVGIPVWIWSYRRFMPQNHIISETTDKDGNKIRKFEFGRGELSEQEMNGWLAAHWCLLIVFMLLTVFGVIL